MEQPRQLRSSNATRVWLLVLLGVALVLVAPTFFALRWWLHWRSPQISEAIPPEVVASYRADYQIEHPKPGWRYLWNANGPLGDTNAYVELRWSGQRYVPDEVRYPAPAPASYLRLSSGGGHPGRGVSQLGQVGDEHERAVIMAFAVPQNGRYAIGESFVNRHDGDKGGSVRLSVFVNERKIGAEVDSNSKDATAFDRDLGNLAAGDNIFVCVSPNESDEHDSFGIDFSITLQSGVLTTTRTRDKALPVVFTDRFHPLPLEGFYQRLLDSYQPTDAWGVVPQGLVELDGIPFRMLGKIEMNGLGASRNRDFKLPRIGEISVNRRAARLHLLGGAGYKDPDGTPVVELRLHYRNGEQRNIFINYGDHIRNWHVASDEKRTDVRDPRCYIVWNGVHPTTGGPLRLFKNTFDNPLPAQEIRGVEFLSLFANSYFALCAITLDGAPGPPQAASAIEEPDDSPFRREVLVRVLDQKTGTPISNATLTLVVVEGEREYGFGRHPSDQRGRS